MDTEVILKWVGNADNSWIPLVTFLSIALIGGLVGFMNGTKTALYFLGWNVVGLVGLVFSLPIALGMAKGYLPEPSADAGIDTTEFINLFLEEYGAVIMAIWLILGLLIFNLLAFITYWFFRGKLKSSMKENKEIGDTNLGIRFAGAGIGVLTAIPFTAAVTTVGTLTTVQSGVTKVNSAVFQATTLGQVGAFDSGQDVATALKVMNLMEDENLADGFTDIIDVITSGSIPEDPAAAIATLEDAKEVLETMLSSEFMVEKMLPTLVDGILASTGVEGEAAEGTEIDATQPIDPQQIASVFRPLDSTGTQIDLRLDIPESSTEALKTTLTSIITFTGTNGVEATQAEIDTWIDSLFTGIFVDQA